MVEYWNDGRDQVARWLRGQEVLAFYSIGWGMKGGRLWGKKPVFGNIILHRRHFFD
jgi:hypothetical protein